MKIFIKKEKINDDNSRLYQDNFKNRFFHPYDSRSLIKRLFGYCNCPVHKRHWFVYPRTIPMNTRYQDEKDNWVTCCEDFYEDVVAPYWQDMWDTYYSSR